MKKGYYIILFAILLFLTIFFVKSSQVRHRVFDGFVEPNQNYKLDGVEHEGISSIDRKEQKLSDSFVKQMKEIYVNIRNMMDKEKIPMWLAGGSLIGAIRHDGFIPWDDDIDLFTELVHYDKVVETLKKKYKVISIHSHIVKIFPKDARDMSPPFIDIFFLDRIGDKLAKCTFITRSKKCRSTTEKETYLIKDIFPLKKHKFENIWGYVPNNYEKVLKTQYGEKVLKVAKVYPSHSMYTWMETGKELYENVDVFDTNFSFV